MEKALKDRNRISLLAVMVANAVAFYIAFHAHSILTKDIALLAKEWTAFISAGFVLVLTSVFNALLSPHAKARLVFWRWRYPLPGCRAFTKYVSEDSRINIRKLEQKIGQFPTDPHEQNTLWYSLYKTVSAESSIEQSHRDYLFTRDYAAISFILMIVSGAIGLWYISPWKISLSYAALLVVQYLIVRIAARNHGIALVKNVLAVKAAD